MIVGQPFKPPLGELVHHGVLGMKWGRHKAAKAARSAAKSARFDRTIAVQDRVNKAKTVSGYNKALDAELAVQRQNKREIAAEKQSRKDNRDGAVKSAVDEAKAAAGMAGKAVVNAGSFAVNHKTMIAGGIVAAALLHDVGKAALVVGKSGILIKAAQNREAAFKAGKLAAKALSSTAAKVNYAKMARGAYKITTL